MLPKILDLATHDTAYVVLPALQEYWHLDYRTLRSYIRQGLLPAYRFGRLWRVKTADARAFEREHYFKAS